MSKTTLLELSKQLKDAGAKQESERFIFDGGQRAFGAEITKMSKKLGYSTFNCHELLEGLPIHTHVWVSSTNDRTYTARCAYIDDSETEQCETPTEALGKLKLWCLQNGHCDE